MEADSPVAQPQDPPATRPDFPFATWGPGAAVIGLFVALSAQALFAGPVAAIDGAEAGDLSTAATVVLQLIGTATFLLTPLVIASMGGASLREALRRLGLRTFDRSAWVLMAAAVGVYLVFVTAYVALVGEPEQEEIAESFGALPLQILLVAIAAPVSEEIFFRGMLFGGDRKSVV